MKAQKIIIGRHMHYLVVSLKSGQNHFFVKNVIQSGIELLRQTQSAVIKHKCHNNPLNSDRRKRRGGRLAVR